MKKTLLLLSVLFLSAPSMSVAAEPSKASQCVSYATNIYIILKQSGNPSDQWFNEAIAWQSKGAQKQDVAVMMVRLVDELFAPDSKERKRVGRALTEDEILQSLSNRYKDAGCVSESTPVVKG
ncbi:hypothetical protein L4C36_16650 [Photobacterium japonica]|uniref:hypothetical protein n=1 Tax=Photobacterium japonica TaxID=2910235 RepID=UPI003D12F363